MDADDEVRDRATYYKCVLEQKNPNQTSDFLLDGIYYLCPNTYVHKNSKSNSGFIQNVPISLISGLHVSLPHLEKALHKYTLSDCINPFDIKKVPKIEDVTTSENSQGSIESVEKNPYHSAQRFTFFFRIDKKTREAKRGKVSSDHV